MTFREMDDGYEVICMGKVWGRVNSTSGYLGKRRWFITRTRLGIFPQPLREFFPTRRDAAEALIEMHS